MIYILLCTILLLGCGDTYYVSQGSGLEEPIDVRIVWDEDDDDLPYYCHNPYYQGLGTEKCR